MITNNNDVGAEQQTPRYQRTQRYEDRIELDLPRILIPTPALDYHGGRPSFHVDSADYERADARCGSPGFLRAIVLTYPLRLEHTIDRWNYESRRSVQSVLPFLLIGPSYMARDQRFVQSEGITFLLAVRSARAVSKQPRYLDPSRFPSASGLATAVFDLDTPYELITNVRPVVKAINDHLEASCTEPLEPGSASIGAKVFVFCETGNERSAVVVAAYLMIVYGIKAVQAIQVVQSQRFCINVDDGMKQMLLSLEDIIGAERGVAASHSEQNIDTRQSSKSSRVISALAKSCKRSHDDRYESDEDSLSASMDVTVKGTQHAGTAPFVDISP